MLPRNIYSGEWQQDPALTDYRVETFSDMWIERATWHPGTPPEHFADMRIGELHYGGPGYIWVRFWLLKEERIVEKYFTQEGEALGLYIPVCMPPTPMQRQYTAQGLVLALWYQENGRMTVLHEDEFDEGVASGEVSPVESEQAEYLIRNLTLDISKKQFPSALIRNFALDTDINDYRNY
ncbi:MAG: hypothetical protein AAF639_38130 [Chloroflexota bacterium]